MVLAASAPGKAVMAGNVTVTATVVAIDTASRIATLKAANGKIVDVHVPPEAKKFEQIRVGDTVTVEYVRALSLELKPGGGIRSMSTQAASAPAAAGAVAGGAAGRQVVIMANVTAVNTKEGFVTLRGPKGNSVDLAVKDPGQMKLIKVGDQVEAVYTEAVAITVEHTPAKKK
jgi:translation initiation factor IF-1